ncbi:MAG: DUF4292 domain-containing protein [Bacteroidetes bacterium]|nr:DUF4292 domain-containing protein [Bacteroidota bacterium]MDA1121999.1 DUF4292 domain-containing protein [Bacteroidota bacterium]
MSNLHFKLIVVTAILLSACGRNIFRPAVSNEPVDLHIQEFDFDLLSAKARFKFDNGKNDLKATANIRIKKDSAIWMSISPSMGIEAARALITKDSLTIIDRIHKQYVAITYDKLSEKYNFKIDYDLIQSVLLGNLSNPILANDKVTKKPSHFLVLQDRGNVKMENYIGFETLKLERAQWLDIPTQNTLIINYTNFQLIDDLVFPYENQIILSYIGTEDTPANTQINIDYSKAEIGDKRVKFPFNIPDKYERK